MKYTMHLSLLTALSLQGAESLNRWFEEGKIHGNIKYYYINTHKEGNAPSSSQHANALGGQLGYSTGSLDGLKLRTTFMTTKPFVVPGNAASVEQSIIAQDNAKLPGSVSADGNNGFSVLGEGFVLYNRSNYEFWYGRRVIETPLIDAKEVRLLPSAVQGGIGSVKLSDSIELGLGYVDCFKQRTSDKFINIVEHAFGVNTYAITGDTEGGVFPLSMAYKHGSMMGRIYDYYAPDFMNSIYGDLLYTSKLSEEFSYTVAGQLIIQDSVGNASSTAAQTIMGGEINTQAVGGKVSLNYRESTLLVAYSHVSSSCGDHDSTALGRDTTFYQHVNRQ